MRIVAGSAKGRRITAPKKLPVRPTTDLAKEALFNILSNKYQFSNLQVLDLFSGTGNISYEFASRGASKITAVDAYYECVKFIKKTSAELNFNLTAIKSDVFKYLEKGAGKSDIIFADPPYDLEFEKFEKIINLVFENELLHAHAQLIIEHSKHTNLSKIPNFKDARKYGNSVFSFFGNQ